MTLGSDGNLYGTAGGGKTRYGSIFQLDADGVLTVLHEFNFSDGSEPDTITQGTDGNFYGATYQGGTGANSLCQSYGCETIFRLSNGLDPFIEAQPIAAKVGASIEILGTNLATASQVTFNGTPAAFTVVHSSLIRTMVPAGAASGAIAVTISTGVLRSDRAFYVLP